MNISDLVKLRNELHNALDIATLQLAIDQNSSRLEILSDVDDKEISDNLKKIAHEHKNITNAIDQDVAKLSQLIDIIQAKIDSLAQKFFEENYQLELQYTDIDLIRNVRNLIPNENFETVLKQRLNLHSAWQFAALEIGCRDGEWTKFLVASDPLYIADISQVFLDSAVEQFTAVYKGRVRKYLIYNFFKIDNLPKNQFGLIFSYNFFNYLSLDSIKQYLIQSMDWLRPGGTIIFTYNNADLPAAASYAENYFMTYVPKKTLIPMAESIGYETIFSYDCDPAYSIIEFKKPGILKSIKAGQAIGEIKPIIN